MCCYRCGSVLSWPVILWTLTPAVQFAKRRCCSATSVLVLIVTVCPHQQIKRMIEHNQDARHIITVVFKAVAFSHAPSGPVTDPFYSASDLQGPRKSARHWSQFSEWPNKLHLHMMDFPISLHCEINICKTVEPFFFMLHIPQNDKFPCQNLSHSVHKKSPFKLAEH